MSEQQRMVESINLAEPKKGNAPEVAASEAWDKFLNAIQGKLK